MCIRVRVTSAVFRVLSQSLRQFGGQGAFTREVQTAVLEGRADVAVHSLKDLPTEPMPGLVLAAVPVPDPRVKSGDVELRGEVPSPANPPSGCYFHPRCPHAVDICRTHPPVLGELSPGHFASCHRAGELDLPGVT
ncbi:MAG: hypothetical protein K6U89_17430, partial [Chloroflexi bacterium]|nr:hypothetical protein [Chloroflexota bacterium]